MFHQVDEEVGGAVEHGEEVGELGDVLDPVGPFQLTLHMEKIKIKSAESNIHKQCCGSGSGSVEFVSFWISPIRIHHY